MRVGLGGGGYIQYSTSTRKRPEAGAVGPAAERLRAARMAGMESAGMRPAAGFDEGADEVADHVVEEAGAGDAVDEEAVVLVPGGVVDGADGRSGQWTSGVASDTASLRVRVVRSGSTAAKEVKSWVPRMWVAACWRVARSRGKGQGQT